MSSSRPLWVAVLALVLMGCAHAERPRAAATPPATQAPPEPAPVPEATAPAPEPGTEPGSEPEAPAPERPARETPAPRHEGRLDPSEEITPEELATIPDPVPGASRGSAPAPRETPSESPESRPGGSGTPGGGSGAGAGREGPWSVQIFASEDRGEAQRVARSAAERLRAPARVDHEPPLYKVRVGRFSGEEEAQALRAEAIRAGYSGAFRVRSGAP